MTKVINIIGAKRSGNSHIVRMIESWCPGVHINMHENKRPKALTSLSGPVVLITRDLLNWWASYAKQLINRKGRLSLYPSKGRRSVAWSWYKIAKEFYGVTDYLKDLPVLKINYDQFCEDQEYRKELCKQLHGIYNEGVIDVVGTNGGGSSFTGIKLNGYGSKMDTTTRCKQVKDPTQLYRGLFKGIPDLLSFYREYGDLDKEKTYFLNQMGLLN